jgi:hypothetical protein
MLQITNPSRFHIEICKILNLDPSKTKDITISITSDDCIMVNVNSHLLYDEAEGILDLTKSYELVPKDGTRTK